MGLIKAKKNIFPAPWYTGMLLLGSFAAVVVLICSVIKAIVKHRNKKLEKN